MTRFLSWLLLDLPPWANYTLSLLLAAACAWPIYVIATHTGAGCPVP